MAGSARRRAALAVLVAATLALAISLPLGPASAPLRCSWGAYLTSASVTSWEFQLDVPLARLQGRNRSAVLRAAVQALQRVEGATAHRFTVSPQTLRSSVVHQWSRASERPGGGLARVLWLRCRQCPPQPRSPRAHRGWCPAACAVSTLDGRPLYPGAKPDHFRWREVGFIK